MYRLLLLLLHRLIVLLVKFRPKALYIPIHCQSFCRSQLPPRFHSCNGTTAATTAAAAYKVHACNTGKCIVVAVFMLIITAMQLNIHLPSAC
jgi:hypothetical protein